MLEQIKIDTGWLKIKYPTRQYAISSQPVVKSDRCEDIAYCLVGYFILSHPVDRKASLLLNNSSTELGCYFDNFCCVYMMCRKHGDDEADAPGAVGDAGIVFLLIPGSHSERLG